MRLLALIGVLAIVVGIAAPVFFFGGFFNVAATNPEPAPVSWALIKVRTEVEKNCEHVGDKFAEEARKIHYGESDKRGIYGETSEEEAEALADEGIEFGRLPWIPRGN